MTSPGANNPSTMLHLRVHLGVAAVYHREPHGFFGGEVTNEMSEEAQSDRCSGGFGRPVLRKPSAACGGPNATGGRCRGATGGVVLLTIFLRHDETKTVEQINEHLRQTGWYDKFPPEGVEIVAGYVMMGIGQVVILRVPAEKLRDTNRVIEQTAWGGYRTEFY